MPHGRGQTQESTLSVLSGSEGLALPEARQPAQSVERPNEIRDCGHCRRTAEQWSARRGTALVSGAGLAWPGVRGGEGGGGRSACALWECSSASGKPAVVGLRREDLNNFMEK